MTGEDKARRHDDSVTGSAAGTLRISISALEELGRLTEAVAAFLDRVGAGPRLAHRTAIVVEELAVNAFRHGGSDRPDVVVFLRPNATGLAGEVRWTGIDFDPTDAANIPSENPGTAGGQGLRIVHNFARSLRFHREASRNRVEFDLVS